MNLFFYFLFISDVIIGILLALFLNVIVGIITACVLLFINIIGFIVILKMEKKKKEIEKSNNIIY